MRNSSVRACVSAALVAVLAACGGGGGGTSLPSTHGGGGGSANTKPVSISMTVPKRPGSTTHLRRPEYISANTNGASITVTQGSIVVTQVFDLSPGSSFCTTVPAGRTCTVTMTVPVGNDTFAITTYDEAPVNGAIPAGAHVLGFSQSTQSVVAGGTTTIQVYLGGTIASIGVQPTATYISLPADGTAHTIAFAFAPADFDNNPITAGPNDPYSNPIQVTLTETGGSGNSTLILNGTSVGTTASVSHSTDTLSLSYNGTGSPGYGVSVSISATGVTPQTLQVSPLIASVGGAGQTTLFLNGVASNPTVGISELNAPTATTYTATAAAGCSGILTSTPATGGGASASFSVAGLSSPSAAGCSIAITDSTNTTLTLPVSNTPISGTINVGGVTITEYSVGSSPAGITSGPDGNVWFVEQPATIAAVNSSGSLVSYLGVPGAALTGIAAGGDGALWATDFMGSIRRVTPSDNVATYPTSAGEEPLQITAAPDGTMWTTTIAPNGIGQVNVGGGLALAPVTPLGNPGAVVYGTDGGVWFTDTGHIARYDPIAQTLSETVVPNGDNATGITEGPDGNIWFTAFGGTAPELGEIQLPQTPPFTITATFPLPAGTTPQGVVGGKDNGVWYVDNGNNTIGRISTVSHALTSYPIPTAGANAQFIALGPDGSLWYTETATGNVGHILP